MKTHSIRYQLIRGTIVLFSLLLGLMFLVVYFGVKKESYREFDQNLLHHVRILSFMIEVEKGERVFEWQELGLENPPDYRPEREEYAVWSASGKLLAASPHGARLPRFSGKTNQAVTRVSHDRLGRATKLAGLKTVPHLDDDKDIALDLGSPVEVVVSRVDTIHAQMTKISRLIFIVGLVGILLAVLFVIQLVSRLLRPLDELRQKVSLVETGEGQQKIDLAEASAELKPVVAELNSLLGRVEDGLERERLMSSNVAHELRTPLAALQANLDLTLSRQRSVSEHENFSREAMDVVQHMNRLVADLLSLSRLSAKQTEVKKETFDLTEKMPRWLAPFEARADERDLRIRLQSTGSCHVTTDESLFHIVLNNLLDNALAYADEGTEIVIDLESARRFSVHNEKRDLHPDFARHAFDPYWRVSSSRADAAGHSGLGLSICQKIMSALGGGIDFQYESPVLLAKVNLDFL